MDIYTKTREDIRKILEVAKACSVQDRIKLFNDPTPFTEPPQTSREERAEAIRREILEAKAQDDGSGGSDIQIQSPVEAKVKPLRIPMKPKLVENVESTKRPEPGSTLRINQPANVKAPEVKSILRTSTHSMDRSPNSTRAPSADSSLPSSISEQTKPKSILVKTKKVPKLVHSNSIIENENNGSNGGGPKIYAQSATDISGGEDDDSERSRKKSIPLTINTKAQFLEVPHFESGLKKSKSFSNPGQYECAMSDQEKSEKQKTIMAFFDASLNSQDQNQRKPSSSHAPNSSQQVVTRRSSAMTIQQRRAQVSSISDEILGEEDLTNVDEAFESLLNSTFQEAQARGRRNEHSRGGSKRRSQSSHPSSARNSEIGSGSSLSQAGLQQQKSTSRKSSNSSTTSSVNRKQSRNKVNSDQQQSSVMPNKEVLADPLGALPTSHTKKYLPRQQTWASGTPPPPPQTPSPTQSEYDTCPDPWEDY